MSTLKASFLQHKDAADPNITLKSDGNIEVDGSADLEGPVSPGDNDSGIALKTFTGETGGCLISTNKTDITTSRTANIGADAQPWHKGYFSTSVSAPNVATAFVNFAGANGALRDSFNVASPVTRLAAGRYRVTFSTAMDNSDYAVMVSSNQLTTIIDSISAASFEMSVFDGGGSRVDTTIICAVVYGGKS